MRVKGASSVGRVRRLSAGPPSLEAQPMRGYLALPPGEVSRVRSHLHTKGERLQALVSAWLQSHGANR